MTGRVHGGPDHRGAARHDFSTCANPLGPCPMVVEVLGCLEVSRYPDPASTALRERLAECHGVAPARILIAASASEFIQRITAAAVRLLGPQTVVDVPAHGYGDYATAAAAWGLTVRSHAPAPLEVRNQGCNQDRNQDRNQDPAAPLLAGLHWWAEPSSPRGQDAGPPRALADSAGVTVLDAVYAPLRLDGTTAWQGADLDAAFVIHGPNKALGLCGLRGAYAVAPRGAGAGDWVAAVAALAPSWPLSVAGVAMLDAWTRPEVRRWVEAGLPTLRQWRAGLEGLLRRHGFDVADSVANYLCARPPPTVDGPGLLAELRERDIAVRDATSFGLPGWWRLSAQPPRSLAALDEALSALLADQGQGR